MRLVQARLILSFLTDLNSGTRFYQRDGIRNFKCHVTYLRYQRVFFFFFFFFFYSTNCILYITLKLVYVHLLYTHDYIYKKLFTVRGSFIHTVKRQGHLSPTHAYTMHTEVGSVPFSLLFKHFLNHF